MTKPSEDSVGKDKAASSIISTPDLEPSPKKGPLSFLSGAITSLLLFWLCLGLSKNIVIYFTLHSFNYTSSIAQSVASGFKTLIIGISFLATFTFGFIGLGLTLVFIRSLFDGKSDHGD